MAPWTTIDAAVSLQTASNAQPYNISNPVRNPDSSPTYLLLSDSADTRAFVINLIGLGVSLLAVIIAFFQLKRMRNCTIAETKELDAEMCENKLFTVAVS
jgi:hypothetical protein